MSTIALDVIIPTYMGNRSDRTFEPTGLGQQTASQNMAVHEVDILSLFKRPLFDRVGCSFNRTRC
jgi:hypothetical protein